MNFAIALCITIAAAFAAYAICNAPWWVLSACAAAAFGWIANKLIETDGRLERMKRDAKNERRE